MSLVDLLVIVLLDDQSPDCCWFGDLTRNLSTVCHEATRQAAATPRWAARVRVDRHYWILCSIYRINWRRNQSRTNQSDGQNVKMQEMLFFCVKRHDLSSTNASSWLTLSADAKSRSSVRANERRSKQRSSSRVVGWICNRVWRKLTICTCPGHGKCRSLPSVVSSSDRYGNRGHRALLILWKLDFVVHTRVFMPTQIREYKIERARHKKEIEVHEMQKKV